MTESEFNKLAGETLQAIENALDECDPDIEFETAGPVLTLTFSNGSQIVVNRHAVTQQIWVAAKSGGYHYAWTDGSWRDTRGGGELFESLSRYASEQAGEQIVLKP